MGLVVLDVRMIEICLRKCSQCLRRVGCLCIGRIRLLILTDNLLDRDWFLLG